VNSSGLPSQSAVCHFEFVMKYVKKEHEINWTLRVLWTSDTQRLK